MKAYIAILEVLYSILTVVITAVLGVCFVKSQKISNKIISAVALLMFVLRIFAIR